MQTTPVIVLSNGVWRFEVKPVKDEPEETVQEECAAEPEEIEEPIESEPPQERDVIDLEMQDKGCMSFNHVMRVVCKVSELSRANLTAPSRFAEHVYWRSILFHLGKKYTGLSTPDMGRRTGGRDHSTVLHGIRKVERNYAMFAEDIALVEGLL